jgi:hypothetical protein
MSSVAKEPSPAAGGNHIDPKFPLKKEGDAPDAGLRSLDHCTLAPPSLLLSSVPSTTSLFQQIGPGLDHC